MMPADNELQPGATGADENNTGTPGGGEQDAKTSLDVMNEALDGMSVDGGTGTGGEGGDDKGATEEEDKGGEAGKADAAAAAKPADKKPGEEKKEPPKDDELYKMPEGLAEKSKERFQQLVSANKEKDTLLQQRNQEIEEIRGAHDWLRQNVLTDEDAASDLVAFADYRGALRSGNLDKAESILKEQLKNFTLLTGRSLTTDPLSDFPDLREKVANLELDEATALELARGRRTNQLTEQQRQQQQQQQQQAEGLQKAASDAVGTIDKMALQWSQTDPDWPAKEKIIMERIPEMLRTIPAHLVHLVPQQIKMLYDSLSGLAVTQSEQGQQGGNVAPLRAGGRGGGRANPQSSLEAMDQALGYT